MHNFGQSGLDLNNETENITSALSERMGMIWTELVCFVVSLLQPQSCKF